MKIEHISPLHTMPVPRNVDAPWLGESRHKQMLVQTLQVKIDGETFFVPRHYITDKASIPRILWPIFPPHYTEAARASTFHDFCYSHLYKQVSKDFADEAFYEILLYDETPRFIAKIFHKSVRLFGKGGWERERIT